MSGRLTVASRVEALVAKGLQVRGDFRAQFLATRVVIHRAPLARSQQLHLEFTPQPGAATGQQRDHPVGQQQRLVHIVGDQHHGAAIAFPDGLDLVLQLTARVSASSADVATHPAAAVHGSIASARATATRWRMPFGSLKGRRSAACARPTIFT